MSPRDLVRCPKPRRNSNSSSRRVASHAYESSIPLLQCLSPRSKRRALLVSLPQTRPRTPGRVKCAWSCFAPIRLDSKAASTWQCVLFSRCRLARQARCILLGPDCSMKTKCLCWRLRIANGNRYPLRRRLSIQLVDTEFHATGPNGYLRTKRSYCLCADCAGRPLVRLEAGTTRMYLPAKDIPTLEQAVQQVNAKIRPWRA
jgi:hypothetical protein